MNIFKEIGQWLSSFFKPGPLSEKQKKQRKKVEPPVVFPAISIVEKPPKNEGVFENQLYYVVSVNKPKWSLFKCPCGCGDVITLSLQSVHRPHWRLVKSPSGRPTLYPSIWRDKGCKSHFWLTDGRISWCKDTGGLPE